ncbi:hypothetical protein ACFL3I_12945 [Pseudomonadota bacterium]
MTIKKHNIDSTEIGGYFGLDLPDYGELYTDVIKFQSGRAAMRAVLECNGITHVMMPAYICGSIITAAVDAGIKVETYSLDEFLYPKSLPSVLPEKCVFIYVNYFGLCQKNISRLIEEIPLDRLIIDNSQALFSPHSNTLATIYSPRKFVGLPDGGLLKASPMLRIVPPEVEDRGSFDRMKFLLTRMAYSAREGFADSHKARDSLGNTTPLAMSRLTQRLMKSIRWNQVIELRRENYKTIAQMMDSINDLPLALGSADVPLCYPLTMKGWVNSKIKNKLASHNVFAATYWPDASSRVKTNTIEAALVHETLFLPIDQRLQSDQIERVGNLALQVTGKPAR